jgi:23S rRNA pseudouridine1911/1915/1917 synthase
VDSVKAYLKEQYRKPGGVFLGVVDRLDRPTSGVVIFARTDKALPRMSRLIRDRELQRVYWAIVTGEPPAEAGMLRSHLARDRSRNKTFVRLRNPKVT